jgi:hypothetical protein
MKLARHSSIATTMKFYRGQTDSADRDATMRMESYLAAQRAESKPKPRATGEQNGERVLRSEPSRDVTTDSETAATLHRS